MDDELEPEDMLAGAGDHDGPTSASTYQSGASIVAAVSGIEAYKYSDPHGYVRRVCSRDTTVDGVRGALRELDADDATLKTTLQSHVYRHHARYISVAKDVTLLVKDKNQLGELLQQLSDTFHGLADTLEAGTLPGQQTLTPQEEHFTLNDVADLDRTSPLLAGDIVHQGSLKLYEVGTQLIDEMVHVFLMPAALVVAQHEMVAMKLENAPKLILLTVEPLTKMRVQDMHDTGSDREHGFLVRAQERYLLLAQSGLEKRAWLRLLRRTIERANLKPEGEMAEESEDQHHHHTVSDEAQAPPLDGWLVDAPDNLDVFIAQRDFEQAVDLVDKAQRALGADAPRTAEYDALKAAVELRIERLTTALCEELERPSLRRNVIRTTVYMLLRLGKADQARTKYLLNWSNGIQRDIKNLKVEGATELFISKLAQLFFATLATTTEEYNTLFDDTFKSMYMAWTHEELIKFSMAFDQQVLQATTNTFMTVSKCFRIVFDQCRQLRARGLDLEFELWELLGDGVLSAIESAGHNWINTTASQLLDETWKPLTFAGKQARNIFVANLAEAGVKHPDDYLEGMSSILCDSSVNFAISAHRFATAAAEVCDTNTIAMIAHCLQRPFTLLVARMGKAYDGQEHLKTNANFVIDTVLPIAIALIETRFGATLAPLQGLSTNIRQVWQKETADMDIRV